MHMVLGGSAAGTFAIKSLNGITTAMGRRVTYYQMFDLFFLSLDIKLGVIKNNFFLFCLYSGLDVLTFLQ